MNNVRNIKKKYKNIFEANQSIEIPGWLGDLSGLVSAGGADVYVTLFNGEVLTVRNTRVANVKRYPVIVGYADKSQDLEVLRMWVGKSETSPYSTPNHASSSHTWPGYDTLWVRPEQFLPGLAIPSTGFVIKFVGFVYFASGWKLIDNQDIDFSAQVPATGAKFLLCEVDSAGVVSFLASASVASREALTYADIPTPTVGKKPLFALKVYAGQASALKTNTYTDIIDLRWAGYVDASSMVMPKYRQFVWVSDGAGDWEFVTSGGEPVFNLEVLE